MDLDDEELKATRMMNGADRNSRVRFSKEIKVSKEIQEAIYDSKSLEDLKISKMKKKEESK